MHHERAREQLALRLYGELSADETRELERHLDGCEACRRFAGELAATLGAFARPTREASPRPLPASTLPRRPRQVTRIAAAALIGLAVGTVLGRYAYPAAGGSDAPGSNPPKVFARDSAPPLATLPGRLAQLDRYLVR